MKYDQWIIIAMLALCAGLESAFSSIFSKEIMLGIVFMLGVWQGNISFKHDKHLAEDIFDLIEQSKTKGG